MGVNVGNLNASLTLQSAQFMTAMKAAAAQSQATSKAINSAMGFAKGAVIGLAGAFSVDMFTHVIKGAFDFTDAIQDLSDRTGASTKFIQEFGYAAQLSGSSVENARAGIEKFSKNLGEAANGNKDMRETLVSLGVSLNDIAKGNVDAAINKAADGIAGMGNKAAQAATTVKLFGKAGQDLTLTLTGGSAGLSDFARKAAELGIVIDSDLIANAGKVNDKLDTTKMILDAQMASMIVKNADALVSLADGVTGLAGALIKFWSQNPQTALGIIGALGGGVVGGLPGAAIGAVGGVFAGKRMAESMADSNMDVGFRKQQLLQARDDYKKVKSSAPGLREASANELNRQWTMFQNAVKQSRQPAASNPNGANDGKGHLVNIVDPKAAAEAAKALAATKAFTDQYAAGQIEALKMRSELTPSVIDQSANDREVLALQRDKANADINDDQAAGKLGVGAIGKARADQLKKLNEQNFMIAADIINQKENEELARQALDVKKAQFANDNDILNGSLGLAKTQQDRRSIMLRLLDNQIAQEKADAEAVLASHQSTDAQKQIAQARLDTLSTLKSQGQQSIVKQTMGPMASYLDSIPSTLGQINESLESVAAEGFGKLNDGLTDAITGAGSLKSAFSDMTSFILSSLVKIALQETIIKPLGSALFGGSGGGGIFGSILGSIFGHRANGGYTAPGMYMVGERGPEMINVGQPSSVMTTAELRRRGANDNAGGMTFNFGNITSNDPAAIKLATYQAIAEAMPMITTNAKNVTIAALKRPTL